MMKFVFLQCREVNKNRETQASVSTSRRLASHLSTWPHSTSYRVSIGFFHIDLRITLNRSITISRNNITRKKTYIFIYSVCCFLYRNPIYSSIFFLFKVLKEVCKSVMKLLICVRMKKICTTISYKSDYYGELYFVNRQIHIHTLLTTFLFDYTSWSEHFSVTLEQPK